ncbi:M20 family peptidase, partial [Virgibacillus dakarensis]|nr:M20 family peptidase [Virgibacillus dakarensis]
YIQKLLPIIKQKALIEDVHVFGQHGFADTRYFSRFGIPAIEFGPSGDHWHGNDEYVVLDSVETYKDILVDFGVGFRG